MDLNYCHLLVHAGMCSRRKLRLNVFSDLRKEEKKTHKCQHVSTKGYNRNVRHG